MPAAGKVTSAEVETGGVPLQASKAELKVAYRETTEFEKVFSSVEEFLGWQGAHGRAGAMHKRTAFGFVGAVDGGRVSIGGKEQECYVFAERSSFVRYSAGRDVRQYYNVKCHNGAGFVF